MRNRSTLEFLGVWEQMNNPNFKVVEFDHFKMEANLIPREITKQQVVLVYAREADLQHGSFRYYGQRMARSEAPTNVAGIRIAEKSCFHPLHSSSPVLKRQHRGHTWSFMQEGIDLAESMYLHIDFL